MSPPRSRNDAKLPEGFTPLRPRNNRYTRGHLDAMDRRLDYLEGRIEGRSHRGGDLTYDQAEAAALRWALMACREWIEADPMFDVMWRPLAGEVELEEVRSRLGGWVYEATPALLDKSHELQWAKEVGDGVLQLSLRPLAAGEQPHRPGQRLVLVGETWKA